LGYFSYPAGVAYAVRMHHCDSLHHLIISSCLHINCFCLFT